MKQALACYNIQVIPTTLLVGILFKPPARFPIETFGNDKRGCVIPVPIDFINRDKQESKLLTNKDFYFSMNLQDDSKYQPYGN